jgi:hypothetical protein
MTEKQEIVHSRRSMIVAMKPASENEYLRDQDMAVGGPDVVVVWIYSDLVLTCDACLWSRALQVDCGCGCGCGSHRAIVNH